VSFHAPDNARSLSDETPATLATALFRLHGDDSRGFSSEFTVPSNQQAADVSLSQPSSNLKFTPRLDQPVISLTAATRSLDTGNYFSPQHSSYAVGLSAVP